MNIDLGRVRAVFRKELRQFRRNRAIVVTMGILPVLFLTGPMINVFSLTRLRERLDRARRGRLGAAADADRARDPARRRLRVLRRRRARSGHA